MRHEEKDRERGMHIGGRTRGILIEGGGVCEYEINEEGKYICGCGRHTWLERYIDRCVPERRSRGPTHTAGGRPKEK